MLSLKSAIKTLHARKDKAYGAAWKRRGERISLLPNIARKVDRLVVYIGTQVEMNDETLLDTGIDLLVYSGKYLLFLAEIDPSLAPSSLSAAAKIPLSDHAENFEWLLDDASIEASKGETLRDLILAVESKFEELWPLADMSSKPSERFELAMALWKKAVTIVGVVSQQQPDVVSRFIQEESEMAAKRTS